MREMSVVRSGPKHEARELPWVGVSTRSTVQYRLSAKWSLCKQPHIPACLHLALTSSYSTNEHPDVACAE